MSLVIDVQLGGTHKTVETSGFENEAISEEVEVQELWIWAF